MFKIKSTKNWRALDREQNQWKIKMYLKSPPSPLCSKKLQQFCLSHQNVLNFSAFWAFFSLDEAEKRVGGKERGAGSRGLTKDHFNRNYWVIALSWAKNNISSMSAIRIRSVGPHSQCGPPHSPPARRATHADVTSSRCCPTKSPDSAGRKVFLSFSFGGRTPEWEGSGKQWV